MIHADILMLIDLQKGFGQEGLTTQQGGGLYVPEGEKAGEPAANLIRHLRNSTIILSQDFHPADQISFFTNHTGVKPFINIYLRQGTDGRYRAIAAEVDGKAMGVETDARGYITHVCDRVLPESVLEGALKTTLWLPHTTQKTESVLFLDPIMEELPADLAATLRSDSMDLTPSGRDERGNRFHIVRKGNRSDLHSYGIATEDDRKSKTVALQVFSTIAAQLQKDGVREASIYIGGLATNYCVEFSHSDIYNDFIPILRKHGIEARVKLLTDISYGIPSTTPDGSWPDLAAAPRRMAQLGTKPTTTDNVIRGFLKKKPTALTLRPTM